MPRVTVILPTYNWSSVLPYSIGSALQQTFTDFELLVVGDGCTDDSEAVVRGVGDLRVRWINLPSNTGHQTGPCNEGLRQARGELIAYLGHDDLWLPHHLSCLVSAIDAGADLAYALTELVGPDGHSTEPCPALDRYDPGMGIPPTGVVHRRSVTEQAGGWRHYRETEREPDRDLWLRAHAAGHRFVFVPRLTAVKFPAVRRRNVYRTRPYHEQAAVFERIRNEDDFEMVELVKMLLAAPQAVWPKPYRLVLQDFVKQTRQRLMPDRLWWRLFRPPPRKGALIDAGRKFKGLERRP